MSDNNAAPRLGMCGYPVIIQIVEGKKPKDEVKQEQPKEEKSDVDDV